MATATGRRQAKLAATILKMKALRESRKVARKTITIDTTRARQEFSECVNTVTYSHQRVLLKRRGKPVAALVTIEDLNLLREIEDAIDLEAAREAKNEPGEVPWEVVKERLGI